MKMHFLIDFLGFTAVKAFSIILRYAPLRPALWIGRRGGDLACLMNPKRRAIAYANLKSAFPEKTAAEIKKILRAHYENLGMSFIELLKAHSLGKRYLDRHVTIENFDRIEKAMQKGRGIIFLTAHFGNWEIASLAMSSKGARVSVFAREQKYTRLDNLLNSVRGSAGGRVIKKGAPLRDIIKALKDNRGIGMLIDQDAGASGVFIDFFGRPASVAPGAAIFSSRTGAAILPVFTRRVGRDRHIVEIGEPLESIGTGDREQDIRSSLEKAAYMLESFVRRFPDQWLWSHKRWKSTPQRSVLVLSDGKAGHINQGIAVAEMVKEALGLRLKARGIEEKPIVQIDTVEVRFKNRLTRTLLDIASFFAGRRWQGCLGCMKFCLEKESFDRLRDRYADIVISCGASAVAANIFLKYENNAKGVVIMKPGLGKARKFDLMILPRHDAPLTLTLSPLGRGKGEGVSSNTLITEAAPNRISGQALPKGHGLGLLIGGDAKNLRLDARIIEEVMDSVLRIAGEMDRDIYVSTSRRTPAEIDEFLKQRLRNNKRCRLLVIANERNIEGAVPKIFEASEAVVVSPDSISMISEAASSGRHVVVFSAGPGGAKYNKAIGNLENLGYIRTAEPGEIYNTLEEILINKPQVKRLDDRAKIIERLKAII